MTVRKVIPEVRQEARDGGACVVKMAVCDWCVAEREPTQTSYILMCVAFECQLEDIMARCWQ